jgi:hypothetical protein
VVKVFSDHADREVPSLAFFASRAIKLGDEMTFNYGTWDPKIKCYCDICLNKEAPVLEQSTRRSTKPPTSLGLAHGAFGLGLGLRSSSSSTSSPGHMNHAFEGGSNAE